MIDSHISGASQHTGLEWSFWENDQKFDLWCFATIDIQNVSLMHLRLERLYVDNYQKFYEIACHLIEQCFTLEHMIIFLTWTHNNCLQFIDCNDHIWPIIRTQEPSERN